MLELADGLQDAGLTVAILTNGTDTINEEVPSLGIRQHVDFVFNSWDIALGWRVSRYSSLTGSRALGRPWLMSARHTLG